MKTTAIIAIIGTILLLTGILLIISDYSNETTYYASGRLLLTTPEWEQFKIDLYKQDKANISNVTYLDSGDTKVIEFSNLKVSPYFNYGNLTEITEKSNISIKLMEFFFTVIGGCFLIGSLLFFLNEG